MTKIKQKIAFFTLFIFNLLVAFPVLVIIFILLKEGIPAISMEFLLQSPRMGMKEGGIFPCIVGTFYLVTLTMIFAVPVGIFAGIYLTEYAKKGLLIRLIRLAIINLAGVPSIVYGLFGLGLFVMFFKFGTSLLSGALTLSVLVLPLIITTTEEALKSIPTTFREASFSLGASRWQTIRYVILPSALPNILTGIIISISRAAGETAPILFTAAAFYLPHLPSSIFSEVMALPYHLYIVSTQIPGMKKEFQYGTAMVLLVLVLGINFFAIIYRLKLRKGKKW